MILDQLRLGVEEQLLIFSASCLSPGRVKKLLIFMLHVPLDSIIESVIAVGGVLLWVSSVFWDTQ